MSKICKNYLIFTFLIMLAGWGTCFIFSVNGFTLANNPLLYIPYLIGGLSPTIASFIAFKTNNVKFMEWLKGIFDFKHNIWSYLFVIIFGIVSVLPQCIISGYDNGAPLWTIIYTIPLLLFGGGLEEAGWRYILQPELEKKFNFTISTLIVAIIWWIWHLPLFFIQDVVQYGQSYFGFGITVFGLSFALASLRKNVNSVWLCVLLHCTINALNGIYIVNDNIYGKITTAIIYIVLSYIIIGIQKKKIIFK
ncbi:CPBP family intramembrane metalloprotease [Spirochaetia bacterium]|nr:CPBP family intramembrane metalloprotease [Spirochaetia bacterium]